MSAIYYLGFRVAKARSGYDATLCFSLRLNRDLRSEATLKSLAVIFASYSGVLYFGPRYGPEFDGEGRRFACPTVYSYCIANI
jgi:hypothetical protein